MINKFKKNTRGVSAQAGFTLVETLVAIMVLMMSIAGPLTLAAKGLQVTLIAKDQDTAFYLAQDAVEYIRWARDTNRLTFPDATSWLSGGNPSTATELGPCVSADGSAKCYFDSSARNPSAPTVCIGSPATCPQLLNDTVNNNLDYITGGAPSIFTRTVSIATPVGGSEAAVTVIVTWYDQGNLQSKVIVHESIFNWQ